MHHIIKILPEDLVKRALSNGIEYAWSKKDSTKVIDFISKQKLLIIEISIWTQVDNTLRILREPFCWTYSFKNSVPTWDELIINENEVAKRYIQSFCWENYPLDDKYGEPYFQLWTIDKPEGKVINYYLKPSLKGLLEDFSSLEKQKEVIVSDKMIFDPFEWAELFFSINESDFTPQEWDILRPYLESARSYFQDPKSRALDGKDHLKMLEYQPWIELCALAKKTLDNLNAIGWDNIKARS